MLMMIKIFCLFVSIAFMPKMVAHAMEKSTPENIVIYLWAVSTTAFIVLQWMM